MVTSCQRLLRMVEGGQVIGLVGVADLGGGVFEYHGQGSFVANPMLGYAALGKLMKKFS